MNIYFNAATSNSSLFNGTICNVHEVITSQPHLCEARAVHHSEHLSANN